MSNLYFIFLYCLSFPFVTQGSKGLGGFPGSEGDPGEDVSGLRPQSHKKDLMICCYCKDYFFFSLGLLRVQ